MKYILYDFAKYLRKLNKKENLSWFNKLILDCGLETYHIKSEENDLRFFTSYLTRNSFKNCVEFRFYYKKFYCYLCVFENKYTYIIKTPINYSDKKIKVKNKIENYNLGDYNSLLNTLIGNIKNSIDEFISKNEYKSLEIKHVKSKLTKYLKREIFLYLKNNYLSIIFLLLSIFILACDFNDNLNIFMKILCIIFIGILFVSLFRPIKIIINVIRDLITYSVVEIEDGVKYLGYKSLKYLGYIEMVDEVKMILNNSNFYLIPYCVNFFNFLPEDNSKQYEEMNHNLKEVKFKFVYLKYTKLIVDLDINLLIILYKYKSNKRYSPKCISLSGLKYIRQNSKFKQRYKF